MKNNIKCAFLMLPCLVLAGTAQAFVGIIAVGLGEMNEEVGRVDVPFSADASIETEDMTANARVYYQPGMVRDEMNVGGQQVVTIRRLDEDKVWILMGEGMYMEVDPETGSAQAPEYRLISREVVGRESVNGMETTKYKSVYEGSDGKFGGFTWYTDDHIAVKGFLVSETKGEKQRVKFEFTDLQRGAQPNSLFEIPDGYQKFDMGGFAGMQGLGQMGGDMPGTAAPPPTASPTDEQQDEDFAKDVSEGAKESAEEAAKQETNNAVQDQVRKGLQKLFGR